MNNLHKDGSARRSRWKLGLACVLAVLWCGAVMADGVPNETCLDCHDDIGEMYLTTPHGLYFGARTDLAEYGCQSCHGNGVAHVDSEGEEGTIINPGNHDQFGGSELCLTCHDGPGFDDWSFSDHNAANLSCAACHTMHTAPFEKSLKKDSPDLCYDCHTDQRAYSFMPSHHPIREGKMSCEDCHSPHGGSTAWTVGETQSDLCFGCHAHLEGPFVYEHAPVNEDCMICHTPHGSVANNLLKENEPALCLNCHSMHFHATIEGVHGDFTSPQAPEVRAGVSTEDGFKRGMLTKCTQCHTEVHGSDMPSQSISTGGNALTR